jgi:hypothetical protein
VLKGTTKTASATGGKISDIAIQLLPHAPDHMLCGKDWPRGPSRAMTRQNRKTENEE